jgi:hypothetical protein
VVFVFLPPNFNLKNPRLMLTPFFFFSLTPVTLQPVGAFLAAGVEENESSMLFVSKSNCIRSQTKRFGAKVASTPSAPGTCSDTFHRIPPVCRAAGGEGIAANFLP